MPIKTRQENDRKYKIELTFYVTVKQLEEGIVSHICSSILAFFRLTPIINSKIQSLNIEKVDEDDDDE